MKKITLISIIFANIFWSCGQIDGRAIIPSTSPVKRIFITSTFYNGLIKGVAGGDAFCNSQAAKAALGGKWLAYMSSPGLNAIDRIQDVGPWYFVDESTLVFDDKAQFATGPDVQIDMNEYGDTVPNPSFAWTGSTTAGIFSTSESGCIGWTTESGTEDGSVGSAAVTTASWQRVGFAACDFEFRLFCIEQ